MNLTDRQSQKFAKTIQYCKMYVPAFERYVPSRYQSYLDYASMGASSPMQEYAARVLAARALMSGFGPTLKIVKTESVPGHDYTSNGFFWAKYPNDLYLEERNAENYEKDTPKYEIALQYLVMHELIHWTRHLAALPADLPGGAEVGDAFEAAAFGRDMSHVWDTGAKRYDRGLSL